MDKTRKRSPTRPKRAEKEGIEFEVRKVRGHVHVVLREARAGSVSIHQSMTFASETEFERWRDQERRRLEFPLEYDQMARTVRTLFQQVERG